MEPYKRFVERILNQGQQVLGELLRRSERGTNKRTFVVAIVAVFTILLPYALFVRPPQDFPAGALIEVPEGMSLSEIAELL